MNKTAKLIIWIVILVAVLVGLGFYCYGYIQHATTGNDHPVATIEIDGRGTIKMELYPEYAPNTVANFIKLAEKGYYNDKVFFAKDTMNLYVGETQAGEDVHPHLSTIFDLKENEQDYEYSIEGEFILNGFKQNTLRADKWSVLLYREDYTSMLPQLATQSYNSGHSQFAIVMDDANSAAVNGGYATFAKVIEGFDVLEDIFKNVPVAVTEGAEDAAATQSVQKFQNYPVMKSVTVDTHGIDYGYPTVQEAFDYQSYMYDFINQYYGGGTAQ